MDPLAKVLMDWFYSGFGIFQMFPDTEEKKIFFSHIYDHIPKFTSKKSLQKHYS